MTGQPVLLDLLSTSQKTWLDIEFEIEQSKAIQAEKCQNRAPFICYKDAGGMYWIVQGCCNSWTCARCGHIRARNEYGRIVEGAKKLHDQGHKLYFWTLTCRGKDCTIEEAEKDYLLWTNRLLSTCRAASKKTDAHWCYIQVTERQKRQHPHSHLISTYVPIDHVAYSAGDRLPNGRIANHDTLWSDWFRKSNTKAGLGQECDLSLIREPVAVAVYVSKYLFKESMNTTFPKSWKRIRYSQNYPKLERQPSEDAFPLVKMRDWVRVLQMKEKVRARDEIAYEAALSRLIVNVLPPNEK